MDEAEATDFQLEELDSDNDALAIGFAIVDEDEDDSDYEEEEEADEEEVVREHNADEVVVVEGASPRVPPEGPLTLSQEAVINDDSENVVEDDEDSRRRAGAGEASSSSQGYGKGAGDGEWSRSEIDGLFCPICMEAWTNGGDHQICCLPCGHLYGARCIKKWLQQRKNLGKCPQCNRKCTLRDLRVIYAPQIVVVDHELQKKVQFLEVKCASLEKKNKDWQEKEVEWQKREDDLHLQVDELTKSNCYLESSLQNLQSRRAGVINAGLNLKFSGQESSSNFVLQNELQVDGARLFDVDASSKIFIIARRLNGMGGMHALTKMSLIAPHEREHIQLPVNTKAVRELRMAPYGRLALLASSGKKLSVISMESNNSVLSYDLPAAGWSCSWDLSSSHYIYTGLQNGMLMVFDMRQTLRPVEFMAGLTCNPIHTVHCLPPDSSFPPGVRSLLTASSVGLCQWNFGGSVERPFLIPESENQGVCIAFAYCPSSNDIVASFRPKVEMSGDDVAVSQPTLTPAASMGQGVQGSHVLFKSLGNRCYQKLGATRSNVDNIRLPRSAILDRQNHGVQFACGDELTRELVLQEMPSLLVVQHLKTWKHPIRDVRYTHAISSGLLSCLTDDTLQIFTSNAL